MTLYGVYMYTETGAADRCGRRFAYSRPKGGEK